MPGRTIHPAVEQSELWPGPAGYPWANTGIRLWDVRKGILRRVVPEHLICTWTTGGFSEPSEGNFAMISHSRDDGRTWNAPEVLFRHVHRGLFTTELFVPRQAKSTRAPSDLRVGCPDDAIGQLSLDLPRRRADLGLPQLDPRRHPECLGQQRHRPLVRPLHHPRELGRALRRRMVRAKHWPAAGRRDRWSRARQPVELPWGADKQLLYQIANAWADRNHRYVAGVMLSDDGGANFRLRGYLCREDARHFIEPKVVELSDGRCVLRPREVAGVDLAQRVGRRWRDLSLLSSAPTSPTRRASFGCCV